VQVFVSFVTGAWTVGVLGSLGWGSPPDESATDVSFFMEGCIAAAFGSSSAFLGGASIFDTPTAGCAANGSSDRTASVGFDHVNSKLLL
jgi:hypothetical protein